MSATIDASLAAIFFTVFFGSTVGLIRYTMSVWRSVLAVKSDCERAWQVLLIPVSHFFHTTVTTTAAVNVNPKALCRYFTGNHIFTSATFIGFTVFVVFCFSILKICAYLSFWDTPDNAIAILSLSEFRMFVLLFIAWLGFNLACILALVVGRIFLRRVHDQLQP